MNPTVLRGALPRDFRVELLKGFESLLRELRGGRWNLKKDDLPKRYDSSLRVISDALDYTRPNRFACCGFGGLSWGGDPFRKELFEQRTF